MQSCPAVEELERLLARDPPDPALERHLEGCAACAEEAQRLRRNDSLLRELHACGASELAAEVGYAGSDSAAGYRILDEIHRGGQGVVYRALQESTRRTVAIKVLLEGALASEAKRLRFEREIEVVAALRHPGIVTVFDSGRLADGRHFFAMEHIEGEPLDVFVQGRRSPGPGGGPPWGTADSLDLFARICDAVQYAHRRGVMHRDLKPANILVDQAGVPRVLDFGLAKATDHAPGDAASLTLTNEFMGTLAYASPEQLLGDPTLVDVRTDVYSLGVILYDLLTGRSPYPATERMVDLMRAISEVDPAPPSSVRTSPRATGRHRVGGELDTIALKALAKDPDRRYQSAGDLGRDVERYLAGEAIDARRDSTWYVMKKSIRRHRLPFGLAAVLLIVLIASTIGIAGAWRKSTHAAEKAQLEARDAGQVAFFLENLFAWTDPEHARGEDVLARDLLDRGVELIDGTLAEQPELEARLLTRMGRCYTNLSLYDKGIPLLERALALRIEHDGAEAYTTSVTRAQLGKAYYYVGSGDAEPLLRAALETQTRLRGFEDEDTIDLAVSLAVVFSSRGDLDEAVALYERVDEALGEDPDRYVQQRANYLANWAQARFAQRRFEEALEVAERALEIQRRLFAAPHPTHVMSLNTLALCYRNLGRYEEGERTYVELLDQCQRLYGAESDRYAIFQKNKARLLEDVGRGDEAVALYRAALETFEATVPATHPHAISCLHKLAILLHRRHAYEEARDLLQRELSILPDDTPQMRARGISARRYLGRAHEALGELEQAEQRLREARAASGQASRDGAIDGMYLAGVLLRRGSAGEARALFQGALETLRDETGLAHLVVRCLYGLGRIELEAGRDDEARRLLEEAARVEGGNAESWMRAAAESALGECLAAAGEAGAEEHLLSGHAALVERLGPTHVETTDALRRVVTFYESTGREGAARALERAAAAVR